MLNDPTIPSSMQDLLSHFSRCFTKRGFVNFVALIIGWLFCQGRHSISRVIQAGCDSDEKRHHSCFYRFLSMGKWAADSIGEVLFQLLLPFLPQRVTAMVDDTLSHKSGPHIFGAAMHFDASTSTYGRGTTAGRKKYFAFGHNWVVLCVWLPLPWGANRGMAIPVLFRLYRSKKSCPKTQYHKRTESASELVKIISGWLPEGRKLSVVGDSEYACKTLVRSLSEDQVFTGPMTMDAALYDEPGPYAGRGRKRKKGMRLPSPTRLAAMRSVPWEELTLTIYGKEVTILVKTQICLWFTVAGTRKVRMVVTRDPSGRMEDRAYFTTDHERSVTELLTEFARRWEIEVAFRNAKQAMGVEDPQNGWWRRKAGTPRPKKKAGPNPRGHKGETAVNHTLALAFAAYAIVVIWYLKHGQKDEDVKRVRNEAPWYRHKVAPSYADMVGAVRRELWVARFSRNPLLRPVTKKIRELLPHWLLAS
ncbi:MAG: transposase [Chloroflexi bacterium]|nr:transposase [Chloroflexota bacterium]